MPLMSTPNKMANMDVKEAFRTGDAEALLRLLSEDGSRADALIHWGKDDCIQTHPLHYISDMIFEGTLKRGKEVPLIEALIAAGADLDFQKSREDGKKSDTPLIGAASLGAEDVGLRLLEAGPGRSCAGCSGRLRSTGPHFLARIVCRHGSSTAPTST